MKFSEWIKRFRINKLHLTQEELALLIGCDQAKISRLENGRFTLHNIINWYLDRGIVDYIKEVENGKEDFASTKGS